MGYTIGAEYQRRKHQIRDGWIIMGILMIMLPLGGQIIVALWYTFMAFAYLDEKPYASELSNSSEP